MKKNVEKLRTIQALFIDGKKLDPQVLIFIVEKAIEKHIQNHGFFSKKSSKDGVKFIFDMIRNKILSRLEEKKSEEEQLLKAARESGDRKTHNLNSTDSKTTDNISTSATSSDSMSEDSDGRLGVKESKKFERKYMALWHVAGKHESSIFNHKFTFNMMVGDDKAELAKKLREGWMTGAHDVPLLDATKKLSHCHILNLPCNEKPGPYEMPKELVYDIVEIEGLRQINNDLYEFFEQDAKSIREPYGIKPYDPMEIHNGDFKTTILSYMKWAVSFGRWRSEISPLSVINNYLKRTFDPKRDKIHGVMRGIYWLADPILRPIKEFQRSPISTMSRLGGYALIGSQMKSLIKAGKSTLEKMQVFGSADVLLSDN